MLRETRELESAELKAAFRGLLALPPYIEQNFRSTMLYLLDHPGNMVRPRLVYQIASAYGIQRQIALELGMALEYFHTASLVFDDLPCMDNAESRRGVECVHKVFGEATAILGALALINRAYALVWKTIAACAPAVRASAAGYIEQHLGVDGLLNGQSFDLHYAPLAHDQAAAERIANGKTVPLIRLTLVLPAILGGATLRELQLFERIAGCWGLAYQMVDDLKDVLQSPAKSGKTSAQDLPLHRPNIVLAIGVPAACARLLLFMNAGDRALAMLLRIRPELIFLGKLRDDLQEELSRILRQAQETEHEGTR